MQTLEHYRYMYTAGHSRLISTGAYIPKQRITSREIMEQIDSKNRFGISYDWLERTTGIRERRVTPDNILPSDMAVHAAQEAMDAAGIKPSEIDVIIYTGITRDFIEPATAHVVQHKIKASNALAFDIANACHGFMNGIHLMDTLIATGQARHGLVVTGEKVCRYTWMAINILKETTDRDVFMKLASGLGLGDAGAAIIMGTKLGPDTGFMGFMLQSQGQYFNLSVCGKNSEDTPLEADMGPLIQEGIRLSSEMYVEFMEKLKWKPEQIARCVQHQASWNMLKYGAKYLGVSPNIIVDSVSTFGNLASANVPINLYLIAKNNEINHGEKVLLTGGGSGISLSNAGLIWDAA